MWTIEIPDYHPPKQRDFVGRHWSKLHALKNELERFLLHYGKDVPKATGKRRVRLELEGWYRGKLPDRDCWDKATLDGLKRAGLLTDDSIHGLEGRMEVEYTRSYRRMTRIILEDCE